jgi:transposase-like protein
MAIFGVTKKRLHELPSGITVTTSQHQPESNMATTYANAVEQMGEDARDLRIHHGEQCPECNSRDTESNGSTEYRCCKCDHRWGREYGEQYGY